VREREIEKKSDMINLGGGGGARRGVCMGKKGTNGSGCSTRNPRPGKRPGKRAHTCPPSDPLAISSHSLFPTTTFHSTPFAPNKTGKGFCVCVIKRVEKERVKRRSSS
jgi:hypothetical protein